MSRRTFARPAAGEENMLDLKTGEYAKPALPVVCERVRFYRERRGMEQKELAARLGVTPMTVTHWEKGRARPDINLLPDLARELGVSIYDLYGLADPLPRCSAEEQALLDRFRRLSGGHRAAVDQMAEALLRAQEEDRRPKTKELTCFDAGLAAGVGDPAEFEDRGRPMRVRETREAARADCVFRVSGDSMQPMYTDGDYVLIQRIPGGPELRFGEIGAFMVGNERYIKVYGEDGLHSLNPRYSPMSFAECESVYLIGRAVGRLDPADIVGENE